MSQPSLLPNLFSPKLISCAWRLGLPHSHRHLRSWPFSPCTPLLRPSLQRMKLGWAPSMATPSYPWIHLPSNEVSKTPGSRPPADPATAGSSPARAQGERDAPAVSDSRVWRHGEHGSTAASPRGRRSSGVAASPQVVRESVTWCSWRRRPLPWSGGARTVASSPAGERWRS
jgi:hypothetical protein